MNFAFTLLLTSTQAQDKPKAASSDSSKARRLQDVEVTSKASLTSKTALSTEATSSPASVTLVGRDYIAKQAVTTYGDLLRPLAGVNVSNYQLGGVGYGIQMRGYVVTEHARDVAFYIDGVPQNQGSSIQANGYVDLNPIIPENIRRIEVIRGPFSPLYGDHALGGAISFETEGKVPSGILVSGGTFGTVRGLATVGFGKSNGSGYVSAEGYSTDGYRDNNGEKHLNGFAKYSFPLWKGIASVRAQAYGSNFGTAGYLPRSDLDAGILKPTAAVSNSDGGTTRQQNLVFNYKGADSANFTSATLYVQHHDFIRIRTNTVGGPQRSDGDNRVWTGGNVHRTIINTLFGLPALYMAGISFRADVINIARYATKERQHTSQSQERRIQTFTPSVYAQLQLKLTERLKLTAGGRFDQLFYDLSTGNSDTEVPDKTLKPNTNVFSPKAGIAYSFTRGINMFFNAAQGFKAPSGYEENLFNPSLSVSKLTSYEVGIAGDDRNGRLHGLLSAYLSDQTGEIQVDPLGDLTNFGKTRRSGIEAEGRVTVTEKGGLSIFGNYTRVIAKIRNGEPDNIYVTNTPEYAATFGLDYDFGAATQANNRFILSVYDQVIGNKNLNSAGTIRSDAFQRLAGKLSYSRGSWDNFRIFIQGSFYPGDGAFDEVSFLSGGKLVTSPQPRATLQGGIKVPF